MSVYSMEEKLKLLKPKEFAWMSMCLMTPKGKVNNQECSSHRTRVKEINRVREYWYNNTTNGRKRDHKYWKGWLLYFSFLKDMVLDEKGSVKDQNIEKESDLEFPKEMDVKKAK